MIMGLQKGGNLKYPCYLCCWDSQARADHYTDRVWIRRKNRKIGSFNIQKKNLVNPDRVIFPALHLFLGFGTQLIKTFVNDGPEKKYIKEHICWWVSVAKINGGTFNGPQLNLILNHNGFYRIVSKQHKNAITALKNVRDGFIGNYRAENYKELVQKMIDSFQAINAKMSLKVHILYNHLDEFVDNLGAYSEQHGERFHQDLREMEKRYAGKDYKMMLADHCWFLIRESPEYETSWKRKSHKKYFKK